MIDLLESLKDFGQYLKIFGIICLFLEIFILR